MLQDAAEDEDASTMESEDEGSFEHVQVNFTVHVLFKCHLANHVFLYCQVQLNVTCF